MDHSQSELPLGTVFGCAAFVFPNGEASLRGEFPSITGWQIGCVLQVSGWDFGGELLVTGGFGTRLYVYQKNANELVV